MAGPGDIRCFVALAVPADVRRHLGGIIGSLQACGADVKWVEPENIHLTLKFLGAIAPAMAGQVWEQLRSIAPGPGPIGTALTKLGAFPNLKRPQTLWAGVECPLVLTELFDDVERRMAALGFERETRRFAPHLTLGRIRSPRNSARLVEQIDRLPLGASPFGLSTIELMQSTLTPRGPVYRPLTTIELTRP